MQSLALPSYVQILLAIQTPVPVLVTRALQRPTTVRRSTERARERERERAHDTYSDMQCRYGGMRVRMYAFMYVGMCVYVCM